MFILLFQFFDTAFFVFSSMNLHSKKLVQVLTVHLNMSDSATVNEIHCFSLTVAVRF
jgi:hypothetical protein